MNDDVILRTAGLGKRFGDRWAVRNLDLAVRRGEVFGFLGPNGAGKSTTIRMLLSLVFPSEGSVELFGRPLRGTGRRVLSRVGGLVERADFYLYLTARKNLEIIAGLRGGGETIDGVLDLVGLAGRAADRVKTFSHGMKQRLGLAQALLGWPELVILDEPTTGLDPQGIKEVRELILRLPAERGTTVFLSSHLLGEIEQTASAMAIINRGTLAVQGNVAALLTAADTVVHIDAHPAETAATVASGQEYVRELRRTGDLLEASMPADRVPHLNAELVRAGVAVRALVPRRSLEDYFLAITEGATDIAPASRRPGR
jgi:ABC-2 type transport system ATP-binding protein